ncbi:hypothetical protein TI39_contig4175g00014 [Zymoseptoria brevis]|uniref:Uncharacterized protein n=1 Tax=Zymoseptoria brevis TaxID=1047168 RepID=A0A0F4GC31_9PEZI|nr:hypothetical protein TI39_contig4175g00014 [Zymoseptoria brevis]
MGLFDLPQELVDEIFDLAYPEEDLNYVNWEQWDSAEMEKKRNDSSYELRPFPQPKVYQFFISKRFLPEASRAWPPPSISSVLSNFTSIPLVISSVSPNFASTLPDVIHLQSNVTASQLCVVAFILPNISDEQSDIVSAWSDFTSLLSSIPSLFTLGRPHITRSQYNITCERACREITLTRSDIPQGRLCDYEAYASAPKSPQQGAESPVYSPTIPMPYNPVGIPEHSSMPLELTKVLSNITLLLWRLAIALSDINQHHIAEHIGHLVDASERLTGPWKELDAGDIPGSVEEIIRLAVNNPKNFLGWLEKTKKPKTEVTDDAEKICEQDSSTTVNASRGLDTDVPFLDIAQSRQNSFEGSSLTEKAEIKTPNNGRKRRIDSSDTIDDNPIYNNADFPPLSPVKQGDGAGRRGGKQNGESWLPLTRAGELDSAASEIQDAIQSTLIVMGWPKSAKHANIAGYVAFMVLMGKDEEHVRNELIGAALGVSRYDATVDDLVRWLFRHVKLLEV